MSNFETHEERRDRLAQSQRLGELRGVLQGEERGDSLFRAVAMLLVDAMLDGDEIALAVGKRELELACAAAPSDNERGRFLGLIDVASWASQRTQSLAAAAEFEVSSYAHEFLKALVDAPGCSNTDLAERLGTSDAEISRVGARLLDAGVAMKRRLGRRNHWDITPRGVQMLDLLDRGGVARHVRPRGVMA